MAFDVVIRFKKDSIYRGSGETLKNITEIHYNYDSWIRRDRIAFESDIDGTGYTYQIKDIEGFEAKLGLPSFKKAIEDFASDNNLQYEEVEGFAWLIEKIISDKK